MTSTHEKAENRPDDEGADRAQEHRARSEFDRYRPTTGPVPEAGPTDPLRAAEVPTAPSMRARFGYAFQGIRYGISTQINLRIHLTATAIVVVLALLLKVPPTQFCILMLTCGAVISAELLNTAVECTVNLASPGYHPLAKAAKDCAAGAVLALALFAVVIGIVIFGPPLLALIF